MNCAALPQYAMRPRPRYLSFQYAQLWAARTAVFRLFPGGCLNGLFGNEFCPGLPAAYAHRELRRAGAGVAHWRNRCLTSLSSREWNVMTHMRPPGFSAANSTSSPSLSASSSPFTAMRSAWKVRRAGFCPCGAPRAAAPRRRPAPAAPSFQWVRRRGRFDLPGDLPGIRLLAVFLEDTAQFRAGGGVHKVGGRGARLVAHVQRRVALIQKPRGPRPAGVRKPPGPAARRPARPRQAGPAPGPHSGNCSAPPWRAAPSRRCDAGLRRRGPGPAR